MATALMVEGMGFLHECLEGLSGSEVQDAHAQMLSFNFNLEHFDITTGPKHSWSLTCL